MKPVVRFSARIRIVDEINPCVIVSKARASLLQPEWRRPLPVLVRLNAGPPEAWRTNLMPRGDGSFFLYLHGPMRRQAGLDVGDKVDMELAHDESYTTDPPHTIPEWFQHALDRDARATKNWLALTPSRRKEVVRYLGALKTKDARERNLQRAISALHGESCRFLGRDWVDGH